MVDYVCVFNLDGLCHLVPKNVWKFEVQCQKLYKKGNACVKKGQYTWMWKKVIYLYKLFSKKSHAIDIFSW